MNFWAFPERVGSRILLLASVDYIATSEHFSGRKKKIAIIKTSIVSVVNFHCMQMSLVMSMRFIFGDDWNDAPCFHHVFYLWEWCNFSRIEALEFSNFLAVANTRTKSIRNNIVEYDIKSTVDKLK